MTVGERIKLARSKTGLTQKQVGEKLGITESAVGQFERPTANPQVDTLYKLAETFGCSVHDFFD